MQEQRFRKLDVWAKAINYIEKLYRITEKFTSKELYGLTSQIRRASTSIALNIAEGSGSGSDNEFRRFLNIALRSSYEVFCGLEIAKRLKFISDDEFKLLTKDCDELSAMIFGLQKKLKADS